MAHSAAVLLLRCASMRRPFSRCAMRVPAHTACSLATAVPACAATQNKRMDACRCPALLGLRWGRFTSSAGRIRTPFLSNTCEAACRSCNLWHQKRVPRCTRERGSPC